MSKKSRKQLSKAKKMMSEALAIKVEALRMKSNAVKTVDDQPDTETISLGSGRNMPAKKWLVASAVILLLLAAGIFWAYKRANAGVDEGVATTGSAPATAPDSPVTGIEVVETWELPGELTEVSSNAFVDETRIACIQDNDGIIYIYNLEKKTVENKIVFGAKGDYEGLSLVGSTYYVLRADGQLFEVQTSGDKPVVKEYDLPLGLENDTEPMVYDQPHNRLLIGVKEIDPSGGKNKGIYSFDLDSKKMTLDPVYVLTGGNDNSTGSEEVGKKGKKDKNAVKPSEIVINYKTGDIYVLNGPSSEFIIADSTGKVISTIQLDKNVFPQPEGMCFSPSGELYISSEGKKKDGGIIARVAFEYSSRGK